MGTAKLLMPFGETTIVERVLQAWQGSSVDRTVVVVRRDDRELADVCSAAGAEVVRPPTDPPDMKASVLAGLRYLESHCAPEPADVWLLAPADMPLLTSALIERVLSECPGAANSIVVPESGGRDGHPVAFPWRLAAEVAALGPDEGVNALLPRHPVIRFEWRAGGQWEDVDTPEEYRRLAEPEKRRGPQD